MKETKQDIPRWTQTDITPDSGNCMMTCFANYFSIPESELPQIHAMYSCKHPESFWLDVLDLWLDKMGYNLNYTPDHKKAQGIAGNDYYFVIGKSIRDIDHMVIYKDGKLFFDPYPGGNGLKKGKKFYLVAVKKRAGKMSDMTISQIKQELYESAMKMEFSQSTLDLYSDSPTNPHHERFKAK